MYIYLTSGTYSYLKKIVDKHPSESMILMQNIETSQLLHETKGKSFFQAPRKYEVLEQNGEFKKEGFISCHFIPIRDEEIPVFEYSIPKRMEQINKAHGLFASRALRPLFKNTYVFIMMWADEKDYQKWKKNPSYKDNIPQDFKLEMLASPQYEATYVVQEEEIEENDRVEEGE